MTAEINEYGVLQQGHSYDVFGRPRGVDLADKSPIQTLNGFSTNRGFTDHEHLDESQLIHMNGRVYDYNLGRFLSVDPFIQEPGNSQSMNPYSYIMNNPLSGTDPSGYAACKADSEASCFDDGFNTYTDESGTRVVYVGEEGDKVSVSNGKTTYTGVITKNSSQPGKNISDIGSPKEIAKGKSNDSEGGKGTSVDKSDGIVGNSGDEQTISGDNPDPTDSYNEDRARRSTGIDEVANIVDKAIEATTVKDFVLGNAGQNVDRLRMARFVYIDGEGWVDLQHVVSAAYNPVSTLGLGDGAGLAIEVLQQIRGQKSAFMREDMLSNSVGAQAVWNQMHGGKLGSTIGTQVVGILRKLGKPLTREEAIERFDK